MPAVAQGGFGRLLNLPVDGQADGRYLSNNRIRTYAVSDPSKKSDLFSAVREKAALMAQAKQFPVIAITKKNCSTTLFNGVPKASSCYLIGQMLQKDESTTQKGKEPVEYVIVAEVIAARLKRLQDRVSTDNGAD
jgi:hypothetical protein